jgi:molecular chaperone DnaK (HSP70)
MEPEAPIGSSVGIDLGTTNSAVSVIRDGVPVLVPVDENSSEYILPSAVTYLEGNRVVVGSNSKKMRFTNPANTFLSVKRVIGRTADSLQEAHVDTTYLKVDKTATNMEGCKLKCSSRDKPLDPEAVSSLVLRKLVRSAERFIQDNVTRAVVAVPAYFLSEQIEATERAATLAGLKKVSIIKEPEAAAIAYGSRPQIVMVFDLGGGTFDVSILEVGGGFVEVIATSGDAYLGGDDMDKAVVNWIIEEYRKRSLDRTSPAEDPRALQRMFSEAEAAKITLSREESTVIRLDDLYRGISVEAELTRTEFERLSRHLIPRLLRPVREAAILAGVNLKGETGSGDDPVDAKPHFSKDVAIKYKQLISSEKEDAAVTKPIRRKKGQSSGEERLNREMKRLQGLHAGQGGQGLTRFPSGRDLDQVILVGGCTRIPFVRRLVGAVTGLVPNWTVDPDAAVCLGAGVYAGVLDGKLPQITILSPMQASLLKLMHEQGEAM